MSDTRIYKKRRCQGISAWTGKPCGAKAVGPNTLKRGTREFLDDRYCQMHQPGRESKSKCRCPYCPVHGRNSVSQRPVKSGKLEEQIDWDTNSSENAMGKRSLRNKKTR